MSVATDDEPGVRLQGEVDVGGIVGVVRVVVDLGNVGDDG
jgi:hypothetical protein